MSKTGTYKVINGKVAKVSDKVPNIASRIDGVYFKEPYKENFGGAGQNRAIEITSKSHKKRELEARGLREFEESNSDVKCETAGKIMSFAGQKHCDRHYGKNLRNSRGAGTS